MSRPARCCFAFSMIATALMAARSVADDAAPADRLLRDIKSICQGADRAQRAAAVRKAVQDMGKTTRDLPFTAGETQGVNLAVEIGGQAGATLLLTAHYDRVARGQGAIDNASGVAVVLELSRRLAAKPLLFHSAQAVFFDLEEQGLLGSKAFVGSQPLPDWTVNFDVFGYGDTLWMTGPTNDRSLQNAMDSAARRAAHGFVWSSEYPPSDHRSFRDNGLKVASFSLLSRIEVDALVEAFRGNPPKHIPAVLEIIHRDEDRPQRIDSVAMARGVAVVEAAIRAWDVTTSR